MWSGSGRPSTGVFRRAKASRWAVTTFRRHAAFYFRKFSRAARNPRRSQTPAATAGGYAPIVHRWSSWIAGLDARLNVFKQPSRLFRRSDRRRPRNDQLGVRINRRPRPQIARGFRSSFRGFDVLLLGVAERPDFIALDPLGVTPRTSVWKAAPLPASTRAWRRC